MATSRRATHMLMTFAGMMTAASALAQPAAISSFATPEAATPDDGAIVVTARRREETLTDVPIAVTAFSATQLARAGALDITDISNSTPNVTLEVSRGTNSTLTAFIRGVGQQDPVAGFEAGVGIYLDDVYLNRPQAAVLDIYDVERIEVLRGPQGTLYGRNTIGGAVKYVTRRLADAPSLKARATYGSYDQAEGVVSGSAPIGDGTIKLGGALARLSRGGFGKNLTTGQDNYNKDIWAGRGTIQIEPSSTAFFRITADYTRDKSNPRGGHRLIPALQAGTPMLRDVFDTQAGLVSPTQDVKAWGISGFGEVKPTDWLTLRSITGYRKDDSATPIDFDSLALVDVDVPAFYNNRQFSQEVQALVSAGGLNGLVGLYYLDASARTVFDVRLPNAVTALTFGNVDTDTIAVFGDFSYDVSPQFSVSAGGRYTWDTRRARILRQTFLGGGSPFFGGAGVLFATTSDFRGSADFKEFTPRVSVSFKPAADQNAYASYSKGFKGGGFDPRGQTTACRTPAGATCNAQQVYDFLAFDPETVNTYEAGYKAQLFNRRLTAALAVFQSDYRDVQVPGSIGTVVNGQQTFIGITTNAGKARIRGVEYEGNFRFARGLAIADDQLSFGWTLGYIDAKYQRFIDGRGIDVADRRRFQNTPKWTASGTGTYSLPLAGGMLDITSTVSWRSFAQQFELRTPGLDQKGYALWDAGLLWTAPSDRWTIGINGRNLADKRYIVSGYNFLRQNPDTGRYVLANGQPGLNSTLGNQGVLTAYYGNPRQVFATLGFKL